MAVGPNGYLTYVRQNTLMAMPFDLSRLEATGPAVPVVEDVALAGAGGSANVAVSPDGALLYVPDVSTERAAAVEWLSRDGKTSALRAAETRWSGLRFSPDGLRLALVETDKQRRLFVHDITRDVSLQVTAEGGASSPVWAPDGKRLAVALDAGAGASNLWLTNADGSGSPTRLTTSPNDQQPYSWDPTGRFLALLFLDGGKIMSVPYTATDTFVLGKPQPWAPLERMVRSGFDLHPDGRRLAISSVDGETTWATVDARDKIVFWPGFFDYLRKNVVVKK